MLSNKLSNTGSKLIILLVLATTVAADLSGLKFYLYTKSNKNNPVELKSSDVSTINNSPFVSNKPTKFLCHGYTSNYNAAFPKDMKNAYLALSEMYNVIAVDWATLSSAPYNTAAQNTRAVGKEIANLIQAFITTGRSNLADFQFIGHSLGGQVGAFISVNLPKGRKIPRVTGLDIARPGFNVSTTPASERLDSTDADFVDIIRTSTGVNSGSTEPDPPSGTVDFYPNGGVKQPGCILDLTGLCSHSRAYQLYQASITTNNFKSYKCASYEDFKVSCPKPILYTWENTLLKA